ncbi:MAG: hypothetical protein ACPIOQ_64305 [Promethearchaeia archaeon]
MEDWRTCPDMVAGFPLPSRDTGASVEAAARAAFFLAMISASLLFPSAMASLA